MLCPGVGAQLRSKIRRLKCNLSDVSELAASGVAGEVGACQCAARAPDALQETSCTVGQQESLCSLLKPLGGGLVNVSLKRAYCKTSCSFFACFYSSSCRWKLKNTQKDRRNPCAHLPDCLWETRQETSSRASACCSLGHHDTRGHSIDKAQKHTELSIQGSLRLTSGCRQICRGGPAAHRQERSRRMAQHSRKNPEQELCRRCRRRSLTAGPVLPSAVGTAGHSPALDSCPSSAAYKHSRPCRDHHQDIQHKP